jgi:hypothetical protein
MKLPRRWMQQPGPAPDHPPLRELLLKKDEGVVYSRQATRNIAYLLCVSVGVTIAVIAALTTAVVVVRESGAIDLTALGDVVADGLSKKYGIGGTSGVGALVIFLLSRRHVSQRRKRAVNPATYPSSGPPEP